MKQGTLNSRIIMLLLLGAILLYLGVSAYRSFRDPYTLLTTYSYTVDDSVEATGWLVREEQVLTHGEGIVELLPQEGERVARGGTVALVYQDSSGLERRQELQRLELEREQLEYALERLDAGGGDSSQLSSQVLNAIVALRTAASTGDLTSLESQSMELKSLIYKREYAYGEEDGEQNTAVALQASLDAVESQISALNAQASQSSSRITASQAGTFSGQVDGYESVLTPAMLENVTPSQLSQLSKTKPQAPAEAVGKLITDTTWYFVSSLDEAQAKRLVEGHTVRVRFSRDWSGEVEMTVERLSEAENGRVAVVLSSTRFLSDTTLLRRQTVELIFESKTGIRVPKQAVRSEARTVTDEETGQESTIYVTGVYALVGQQAEFKPVTVLEETGEFTLVEPAQAQSEREEKKALRAGDTVIVAAESLYDGMVIIK